LTANIPFSLKKRHLKGVLTDDGQKLPVKQGVGQKQFSLFTTPDLFQNGAIERFLTEF
jgi:hypothetical protein